MKKTIRMFLSAFTGVCLCASVALAGQAAGSPFPGPGKWQFSFKPEVSSITYFLKGNVHDTLGTVTKMQGSASASITAQGRLAEAAVQFTFAADAMDSKDAARDERMKKKFMEISLYPEVSFRSTAAGPGLKQAAAVAQATRERPISFDLEGSLKIHGTERQVTIPVTVYQENGLLMVQGATTLALKDFNIANPSFFVFRTEDTVKIDFHIELQPESGAQL